jgi:hypothetical protein
MANTQNFTQEAKRLVYPNGIQVTLSSITTGAYNIENGSVSSTSVDTTLIAFPKQVKVSQYNYPDLIGKTVLEFLVVASDLASSPKPLDKLIAASIVYTVERVSEHYAGGQKVLYKVLVTKG